MIIFLASLAVVYPIVECFKFLKIKGLIIICKGQILDIVFGAMHIIFTYIGVHLRTNYLVSFFSFFFESTVNK